MMTTK